MQRHNTLVALGASGWESRVGGWAQSQGQNSLHMLLKLLVYESCKDTMY